MPSNRVVVSFKLRVRRDADKVFVSRPAAASPPTPRGTTRSSWSWPASDHGARWVLFWKALFLGAIFLWLEPIQDYDWLWGGSNLDTPYYDVWSDDQRWPLVTLFGIDDGNFYLIRAGNGFGFPLTFVLSAMVVSVGLARLFPRNSLTTKIIATSLIFLAGSFYSTQEGFSWIEFYYNTGGGELQVVLVPFLLEMIPISLLTWYLA